MNYQEFIQTIQLHFSDSFGPDTTLKISQITKNNGCTYDGLVVMRPDINISPTIYLMPYYNRYLDGVSLEDIYQDIFDTFQRHLPHSNFDTSIFTDFSRARRHIVMRLVNYEKNKDLLQDVPHIKFLDLAIVFYHLLHANNKQQANILIHNQHLAIWNTNTQTLYEESRQNTPLLLPYQTENIADVLAHLKPTASKEFSLSECPMLVLSNIYRTNGAASLLYPHTLSQLADSCEKDFIIIPSSIHEVLLLPTEHPAEDYEYISQLVHEVNASILSDEEILSDHAYYYSRTKHMLYCSFPDDDTQKNQEEIP